MAKALRGGKYSKQVQEESTSTQEQTVSKSPLEAIIGQSVEELRKYAYWNPEDEVNPNKRIREDFNLEFATEAQLDAIRSIFKGMIEHDKWYDEDRTPFIITNVHIQRAVEQSEEELQRNKEIFGRRMEDKTIQFSVTTEPVTTSSYIRMVDTKYRMCLIGDKGGYFTLDRNGKKKRLTTFSMAYGTKNL